MGAWTLLGREVLGRAAVGVGGTGVQCEDLYANKLFLSPEP